MQAEILKTIQTSNSGGASEVFFFLFLHHQFSPILVTDFDTDRILYTDAHLLADDEFNWRACREQRVDLIGDEGVKYADKLDTLILPPFYARMIV